MGVKHSEMFSPNSRPLALSSFYSVKALFFSLFFFPSSSCFCSAKALLHSSILSVRLLLYSCFCSSTIPESGNFLIKPASLRGVSLMLIKIWLAKMARGKTLTFLSV